MTKTIRLSDAIEVVLDNLAFSVKADIIKALSALPAVGGWLPIESAPKDGDVIRVGVMTDFGWVQGSGRWVDASGGFWLCRGDMRYVADGLGLANPTHWQPLPAPPIE